MIGSDDRKKAKDDAREAASQVYAHLKEKHEDDPLSLDPLDRVLLLASASVDYVRRSKECEALVDDLRSTIETRLRLAGKLVELYESGNYTGDSLHADVKELLPEDTDRMLFKLGLLDLAQRVAKIVGKVSLLERDRYIAEFPGDSWPFRQELLQVERDYLVAAGKSPDDPGFEKEAMKRAMLKIAMGPERFAEMECRQNEG